MRKLLTLFTMFVLFAGESALARACDAAMDSCDFYLCIEKQNPCGARGYALHFGYRKCQRYLEAQSNTSQGLKKWFPEVRFCLQEEYQRIATETPPSQSYCRTVRQEAIASHLDCYVETGFCELSPKDKWRNLQLVGLTGFLPSNLRTAVAIEKACAAKSSQP